MTERDLEKACMAYLRGALTPMPLLWKIADRFTGGQPDIEVAWNGHTTKIEFKKLKTGENIHDKWEDGRQLIACVRYEQATHRCWVVAYHRVKNGENYTIIYRPSKLLNGAVPVPRMMGSASFDVLWNHGALVIPDGFVAGHRAVAALIRETHR